MSAVLAIFCNILINPLDPQVTNDIELVEGLPTYLRCIKSHPKSQQERIFLGMAEELCAELGRLGRSAVAMAREHQETWTYYRYSAELAPQSSSGMSS
jgi:hypothetical protein